MTTERLTPSVRRVRRLAEEGHDVRRPEADYLRDGIHELRAKSGRVINYRVFDFFHGGNVRKGMNDFQFGPREKQRYRKRMELPFSR